MKRNIFKFVTLVMMVMVTIKPVSLEAATYYTNEGLTGGIVCYSTRTKVTSSVASKKVTEVDREKVGGVNNKNSSTPSTMSVSLTKSKTRNYSFSVSADTPLSIFKNDVKAQIGGNISFSESKNLSCSKEVPARKKGEIWLYYEKEVTKFKYVCQRQQTNISGKWYKKGSSYTKYGTTTTKVPFLEPIIK